MYTVRLHCLILHPVTHEALGDKKVTVKVEQLGRQPFIQAARERLNTTHIRVLSYRLIGTTPKD